MDKSRSAVPAGADVHALPLLTRPVLPKTLGFPYASLSGPLLSAPIWAGCKLRRLPLKKVCSLEKCSAWQPRAAAE